MGPLASQHRASTRHRHHLLAERTRFTSIHMGMPSVAALALALMIIPFRLQSALCVASGVHAPHQQVIYTIVENSIKEHLHLRLTSMGSWIGTLGVATQPNINHGNHGSHATARRGLARTDTRMQAILMMMRRSPDTPRVLYLERIGDMGARHNVAAACNGQRQRGQRWVQHIQSYNFAQSGMLCIRSRYAPLYSACSWQRMHASENGAAGTHAEDGPPPGRLIPSAERM